MHIRDLHVAQLHGGLASDFAGMLLASAGARVTRVDDGLDDLRRRSDQSEDARFWTSLDVWLNRSKRHAPMATLSALLPTCQVVIDDLSPEARRGAGWAPVPTPVPATWIIITPWGSDRWWVPGSDLTAAAVAGAIWPIGRSDREPIVPPHDSSTVQAGTVAAILAAASVRDLRPVVLDVSISEVISAYASMNALLFHWEREGHRAARSGGAYPYTILPCLDGHVCIAARTNSEWHRLLRALGSPHWAEDERFQDVRTIARKHADEADILLCETLRQFTQDQLLQLAAEYGCTIAPVRSIADVSKDADLRSRGTLLDPSESVENSDLRTTALAPALTWFSSPILPHRSNPVRRTKSAESARHLRGWLPLSGLRILDFGWIVSAPLTGLFAAALGAEVIKVESATRLDNMRRHGATINGQIDWQLVNCVPMFHALNRGKRSFVVDIKTPDGLSAVKELIRHSDAVIENFTVGTFERLGLDDSTLQALNPKVIRISLTATGRTGRLSLMRGYAASTGALAGLEGSVGYSDNDLTGMLTFGLADFVSGAMAAFALVAALSRRNDGYQSIDASQLDANVVCLGIGFAASTAGWTTRPGNHRYTQAPCGVFRSKDGGYVALTASDDEAWRGLAPLLGLAPNDHATLTDRRTHASELTGRLSRWISQRERDDAVALLREHGQDAAPVLSMHERRIAEIFATRHADAHIVLGNGSQVQIPLQPWLAGSLDRTGDDWRAPDFGADTVEIARDILKTPARDLKRLIAAGVLGVPAAPTTSQAKG